MDGRARAGGIGRERKGGRKGGRDSEREQCHWLQGSDGDRISEPWSGGAGRDLQGASAQPLSKFIPQMQCVCRPPSEANAKQLCFTWRVWRPEALGGR